MSDREKIEAILDLLTDKSVGRLVKQKQLETEEEEFGALVALGSVFRQAYAIYQDA